VADGPTPTSPDGSSEREVFDLAPEVGTPPLRGGSIPHSPKSERTPAPEGRGTTSDVELIDTHTDDADEDAKENPPLTEPLVSEKLVSWQRWAWVGAGLAVVGAWLGYHYEPRFSILRGLLVLYYAPVLTLLGVGAGFAMATLEGRRVGNRHAWRELAARLLTCVAAGLALAAVDFPLVGRAGGAVLGAGVYFGLLMLLLGWPAARAARLASAHFVLAVLIYIPVAVARWMAEK
jgi:hypothetical protein